MAALVPSGICLFFLCKSNMTDKLTHTLSAGVKFGDCGCYRGSKKKNLTQFALRASLSQCVKKQPAASDVGRVVSSSPD